MDVLIVDDSKFMRQMLIKGCTQLGYKTLEASNGVECLEQLNEHVATICLILLDWNMPIMDGYEALTKIRSNNKYDHIPIIMATADSVLEDIVKANEAGADSYLIKPFTAEELTERIAKVVKIPAELK